MATFDAIYKLIGPETVFPMKDSDGGLDTAHGTAKNKGRVECRACIFI